MTISDGSTILNAFYGSVYPKSAFTEPTGARVYYGAWLAWKGPAVQWLSSHAGNLSPEALTLTAAIGKAFNEGNAYANRAMKMLNESGGYINVADSAARGFVGGLGEGFDALSRALKEAVKSSPLLMYGAALVLLVVMLRR